MQIDVALEAGILPALAGNTSTIFRRRVSRWDHPRACGEHRSSSTPLGTWVGSSSRLWGTRTCSVRLRSSIGIIPALAGNTHPGHCRQPVGKLIIPALAGNTHGSRCPRARTGDHPRACGEHTPVRSKLPSVSGSSPRLRGTPFELVRLVLDRGIIPALAGNTRSSSTRHPVPWDHPRACGEHNQRTFAAEPSLGSSPRLRGTHPVPTTRPPPTGIIPALAGNTTCMTAASAPTRDHPRACGEHGG